jgi:predicted nucleotidyltransferase
MVARDRRVEPRRSDQLWPATLTGFACVTAIVLAVWPSLRGPADYDPQTAILTVTFIGGAILAYYARLTLMAQTEGLSYAQQHDRDTRDSQERKDQEDLARRRAALATAVLAELSLLTSRLAHARRQGSQSYHDPLTHPVMNEALRHTEILDPRTVQVLANLNTRIRDVQLLLTSYRELKQELRDARNRVDPSTLEGRYGGRVPGEQEIQAQLSDIDLMVRANAAWAHNDVAGLVDALRDLEGGAMPPTRTYEAATPEELPKLGPNPFG